MELNDAIRTRRTIKAFAPEPLSQEQLDELFELARWAPNHKLTSPWRFRVLGPQARAALKTAAAEQARASAPAGQDPEAAGFVAAAKLDRAPTLVVVSSAHNADPVLHDEDVQASGVAAYIVLLAAHDRGFAGYWRTPAILRDDAGRAAVGVGEDESVIGLLYLGHPVQDLPPAPEREAPDSYVTYLA